MPQIKMFGSSSMPGVELVEGEFHGFVTREFNALWFDLEAPEEWRTKYGFTVELAQWLVTNVRETRRVTENDPNALLITYRNLESGKSETIIWDWTTFARHSRLGTAGQYKWWFKEVRAMIGAGRKNGEVITCVQVQGEVWYPPKVV